MNWFRFILIALLLTACAPAVQGFVDLPPEQELAITSIVIAVVALALDWLIGRFPWLEFFRQYREVWSLAVATLVIKYIENALPTGSDPLSIPLVQMVIAALVYLLGRMIMKRRGVQALV